jgi:hypothetical protein
MGIYWEAEVCPSTAALNDPIMSCYVNGAVSDAKNAASPCILPPNMRTNRSNYAPSLFLPIWTGLMLMENTQIPKGEQRPLSGQSPPSSNCGSTTPVSVAEKSTPLAKEDDTEEQKPQFSKCLPIHPASDWISRFWIWEASASALSLTCFAAIIGVLSHENGRPLEDWTLAISPNSVLALIATLAKSSLLLVVTEVISQLKWIYFTSASHPLNHLRHFDHASRGPLGALHLMISNKTFLGWFAASITLLALLVDPFVQAVLTFPSQQVEDSSRAASFQRALFYNSSRAPRLVGFVGTVDIAATRAKLKFL